ncbi:MAG: nucleoside-diphosphate kinase [Candidatus Thorarchaeota archaeon]|jgi:nucleoside diphosphate kinase
MERALVLVKADAISRGLVGRVIRAFENRSYIINGLCQKYKDEPWVLEVYGELYGDNWVKEYLVRTPLIGFLVIGEDAHQAAQSIMAHVRGEYAHSPKANLADVFIDDKIIEEFYSNDNDMEMKDGNHEN